MMALANVENILIRLQYVDQVQREVELLNIIMDSAANRDMGLGSATLVEECRCPVGYSGLSCESCAHGFVRQQTGAWLGRCIPVEEPCRPGTYGDPFRGVICKECPCPLTTSGNNFARTCALSSDGDVQCHCDRGYTGRRCEECEEGYVGNPTLPGGSCQRVSTSNCNPTGTYQTHPDGRCECKKHVTGSRCDQCTSASFFLNPKSETGCIDCFCMGVSSQCTSSSWYRDSVQAVFTGRNEFSVISNYDAPREEEIEIQSSRDGVSFQIQNGDSNVYYWKLPVRFAGNKVTAYGGHLNYTVRYVPLPGGFMSRNNAPDVVILSLNDITILHYRKDETAPSGSQSYHVPIVPEYWQRLDGNRINREHLLMALADVAAIFIKATYTTTTEEAALSYVSLDTATEYNNGWNARALEVEQCSCPPGHQGLSCEDCSMGYTRGNYGDGLYLGLCNRCECNGHSDDCHPETGVCSQCRDNTDGEQCDQCLPGYSGNATQGTPYDCSLTEHRPDDVKQCEQCDIRGYTSCNGQCNCKVSEAF